VNDRAKKREIQGARQKERHREPGMITVQDAKQIGGSYEVQYTIDESKKTYIAPDLMHQRSYIQLKMIGSFERCATSTVCVMGALVFCSQFFLGEV